MEGRGFREREGQRSEKSLFSAFVSVRTRAPCRQLQHMTGLGLGSTPDKGILPKEAEWPQMRLRGSQATPCRAWKLNLHGLQPCP